MAILQIDHDRVVQRCDACGFERELGIDLVEIGVLPDAEGHIDVDGDDRADPIIALPSCNRCGSAELLQLPDDDVSEAALELSALWRRLGGEPFHLDIPVAEPSTEDISTDDLN